MNDQKIVFELPANIEHYLAILSKYYAKEGRKKLQEIIINAQPRIHAGWSYENWNGGNHGHALYLAIPESIYLSIVNDKVDLQNRLREGLNKINDVQNEYIAEVFFEIETFDDHDWRRDSGLLITQKRIVSDSIADRIWIKDYFRAFLSHKTEVKKETSILKENLKSFGVSCFVAHEDIFPTKEWQNEIENALQTMDSFIALLTDDFHDSLWTDQEVGFAFGRGVPIISVKLGKDPYGFIGKFQALSSTWETAPFDIMKILIKRESMIKAYINTMSVCHSYNDSNNLAKLLPFIDNIPDDQIDRIITIFNENDQIRDSYGFNGKNPERYGYGLLHHLERMTNNRYRLSSQGHILK